ncbi:hypothetical protein C8R46DRAFT_1123421 [Mycena filopes]|nr:hypothetical protein C8R46DRAFT_1123421 [Mycena filopes]
MLPLRSFLRSSTRLSSFRPAARPSFRPQQRPYYLFNNTPRPTSLGARIWFRRDGTPRSKIRGLVITSLLSGLIYTTWNTLLVVEALDYEHYLLSTLVYIQRVDYDYPALKEGFKESLAYFADLCAYFCQGDDVPQEMVDSFFRDVAAFEADPTLCDTVHAIMRDASAAVHDILVQSKGTDPTETAVLVVNVVDEAMMQLIELTEDVNSDEIEKMLRAKRLREQMSAKESSKSYEILG